MNSLGADDCAIELRTKDLFWGSRGSVQLAHVPERKSATPGRKDFPEHWVVEIKLTDQVELPKMSLESMSREPYCELIQIKLPNCEERLQLRNVYATSISKWHAKGEECTTLSLVVNRLKWLTPYFEVPISEVEKVAQALNIPGARKQLDLPEPPKVNSLELELQNFWPSIKLSES